MHFSAVTIGIVTHNSAADLPGLLESLLHLDIHQSTDLLFVDNQSTDDTCAILNHHLPQLEKIYRFVKVIANSENNIASARNQVLNRALTEAVAFVDSDCTFAPTWLAELTDGFAKASSSSSELSGYGGGQSLVGRNEFSTFLDLAVQSPFGHGFSPQARRPGSIKQVNHIPCTNVIFDRQRLIAIGGFSPAFALVGEDREIAIRILKKGWVLSQGPHPLVHNNCANSLCSWALRMYRFGNAQIRLFRFNQLHGPTLISVAVIGMLLVAILNPPIIFPMLMIYLVGIAIESIKWGSNVGRGSIRTLAAIFLATHFSYVLGFFLGMIERLSILPRNLFEASLQGERVKHASETDANH